MTLMPHLESSCLITPENMDRAALDAPYAAYLGSGMPPAGAIETDKPQQWLFPAFISMI